MYFTSWYTAVYHSTGLRELTYLALMIPGYVFFWTLLRVDPVPKEYLYVVTLWITVVEVIGDMFFGIAVIADQNLIGASYFRALGRPWGPRWPPMRSSPAGSCGFSVTWSACRSSPPRFST